MTRLAIDGGEPVREDFLVFGAPQINEAEIAEVVDCMRRGWIGTGPKVHRFEEEFRAYVGAGNAVALSSCTAALRLAMLAAGIGRGDEVITTAMTFCATVNCVIHAGAVPVLADCVRDSMNISPADIEAKITPRTRAIIPVHFAGRCCEMDQIMGIADRHNLIVVEDCAHAIETEFHGKRAGLFGDFGCFSFYVTKNVITGEGGMLVTENDDLAAQIRVLGLHGMSKDAWKRFSDDGFKHYQVVHAGFKENMTDIQAAMGIHQLARVEENWEIREKIWIQYGEAFSDLPCIIPLDAAAETRHAYHLYTPLIDIDALGKSRDWALAALTAENIGVGVHYIPVHAHPFCQQAYDWKEGDFPNAEWGVSGRCRCPCLRL